MSSKSPATTVLILSFFLSDSLRGRSDRCFGNCRYDNIWIILEWKKPGLPDWKKRIGILSAVVYDAF